MHLFPYQPRKHQTEIIQLISEVLSNHRHLVLESGTGSGKTVCALTATLEYALNYDKKIVYITRTNSQQQQVLLELRAIREHAEESLKPRLFGVGIQGRANMCLQARYNTELSQGTAEELSKFCAAEKKKVHTSRKGCKYYRNVIEDEEKVEETYRWVREKLPYVEDFIEYCDRKDLCPYEINKELIRDAILVVVPYIYVFNPIIRNMLLDWLSRDEDDLILVVDEAHNLPDYLRDLFSSQLSYWMLKACIEEVKTYGDPTVSISQISVSKFCKTLSEIIRDLRDTYVYSILEDGIRNRNDKQDAFLPSHEFETEILSRLSITSKQLDQIIEDLLVFGEKIQEYKQQQGKLPRSYVHHLGEFLEFWMNLESEQYAKLIVDASEGRNPRIEAYCLDPSIGGDIIKKFHATIHMSGTLQPLQEYRDSMGLPDDTILSSFPSPFPRENRRILYVADVTTKYDAIMKDRDITNRIENYITDICNTFPRNTMVFFPSFNILTMFQSKKFFKKIKRSIYIEEQKMPQSALMDLVSDFKSHADRDGATMFSVIGGRISEGMDFPASQLEIALIVGIPYPKPTARQRGLQHYYEMKFHKGWEYTVEAPTARKLVQSIGRLIRNENDRGIAVILDWRAKRFRKYLDGLRESKDLIKDIKRFIEN